MVVVAIIGILAAVGIPSFKKYQAKAKTAEAKIHLTAIYTVETTLQAEFDTYNPCLSKIGYNPSAESSNRYYRTGFNNSDPTNTDICGVGGFSFGFPAGRAAGGPPAASFDAYISTSVVRVSDDGTSFLAAAIGWVSPDRVSPDYWGINHNKNITHTSVGY